MILTLLGTFGFAQVIFQVQAPSTPVALQTTYPLTWADPGGGDWACPDLNIPANSITGELIFVDDGTPGIHPTYGHPMQEQACASPGFSQPALAGKIAVLYRGDCQFGYKAAVCENEGAIGVIIINHTGAAVGMAGGDSGLVVTIPLIMISEQDGQTLEAAIHAGTITQAFIGNKFGIFADDLGARRGDVLRARRFSNLAGLSQNATEFSVPVGSWVRNFGSAAQTGAQLKCTVNNGTQIYADSAIVPGTLASGDSAWVSLSTFSQASYPVGQYTMEYTISLSPNPDGEPSDNLIDASFAISDSLYSYGRLDAGGVPLSPAGFRSGNFSTDWEGCLAFDDPNGSRASSLGMTISATTSSTDSLTNQFVEARVYQWDDVFTDIEDPNLNFAILTQLDAAFFVYGSDLQDVPVFIPHAIGAIPLADNQRYLFCLNSPSQIIFAGYDSQVDYSTTQDDGVSGANGAHLQPSTPGAADGTYFLNGFGLDVQVAASVQMSVVTSVDESANNNTSVVAFPNPASDELNIQVGNINGAATIEVFDIAGKLVMSNAVTFGNNEVLKLDVSAISNGSYIGKMTFEDGTSTKFNVVVSK